MDPQIFVTVHYIHISTLDVDRVWRVTLLPKVHPQLFGFPRVELQVVQSTNGKYIYAGNRLNVLTLNRWGRGQPLCSLCAALAKARGISNGWVYDTLRTRMSVLVLFLFLIFESFLGNINQVPLLILSGGYLSLCYFLLLLQMFRSIKFRSVELHLDIYFYKGVVLTEINRETILETKLVMCNIYAPNKEDPDFFNELNRVLGEMEGQIILAGDFNQVMDVFLDKIKFSGLITTRDRAALKRLCEDLGLVDIWRLANPKERDYHAHTRNLQ